MLGRVSGVRVGRGDLGNAGGVRLAVEGADRTDEWQQLRQGLSLGDYHGAKSGTMDPATYQMTKRSIEQSYAFDNKTTKDRREALFHAHTGG